MGETSASSGHSGSGERLWLWKGNRTARELLRRLAFNIGHFSSSPVAALPSLLVLFNLLATRKCRLLLNVTYFSLWIRSPQDLKINVI